MSPCGHSDTWQVKVRCQFQSHLDPLKGLTTKGPSVGRSSDPMGGSMGLGGTHAMVLSGCQTWKM